MITYLPDGREVTITQAPGPVFKAVLASDPDGVFGYGVSADAAVEKLRPLDGRETLHRALRRGLDQAYWQCGGEVPGGSAAPDHYPARQPSLTGTRPAIHHMDGNPWNNDPGNLRLVNARENFAAANINASRLENQYMYPEENS